MNRLGSRAAKVFPVVALCAMLIGCGGSQGHGQHTAQPTPTPPVGSLDTLGTGSSTPAPTGTTPPSALATSAAPSPTADPGRTEDDARYTVRRYLSRWIGQPLQPDDTEGRFPLVCAGSVLAANPGKLTGTLSFDNDRMTARRIGDTGAEVTVPVTNSATVTTVRTFTLRAAAQGYCIEDIIN
ncbi:hypothetical protein [Nocardia sp. JMUB6875]|uniref:hypothetical protein n=1 Tax=Nocardia sp. JMUB6875 TaxID=3158170 RepID=UPI0034E8B1F1